jgi:hypothetical protein
LAHLRLCMAAAGLQERELKFHFVVDVPVLLIQPVEKNQYCGFYGCCLSSVVQYPGGGSKEGQHCLLLCLVAFRTWNRNGMRNNLFNKLKVLLDEVGSVSVAHSKVIVQQFLRVSGWILESLRHCVMVDFVCRPGSRLAVARYTTQSHLAVPPGFVEDHVWDIDRQRTPRVLGNV